MATAGSSLATILVFGLALALLGGCGDGLRGGLTVEHRDGGQRWSTTPDECVSGERQGFFGVDMRAGGSDAALVRVILDERDGAVVQLNVPGTDHALFVHHRSVCARFDVHVERAGNGVDMRGHVRLECDDPGFALQADITFERCH
jgi:hypothetical protein